MLVTEYAKGNELNFRVESLKVYGVLVGLLCEEDQGFAVMMDMVGVEEDGGFIGRERVSGGSWVGVRC
jgi:hypothetical protein